ncbi:hypothetical protein Droror1_Dr00017547 [Drosera rotundifolia]
MNSRIQAKENRLKSLESHIEEEDLRKVSEKVGDVVEVRLLKDSVTGKNRGFAFVRFATSSTHTAAISKSGELYTWGREERDGRLGLGPGRGLDQADGQLWNWGANSNYELGSSDKVGGWHPRPVSSLEGVQMTQIACGRYHSLALTDVGKVLSWGHGGHGQLGHSSIQNQKVPTRIDALADHQVVFIACGGSTSAAITFYRGYGGFGALGQAVYTRELVPRLDVPGGGGSNNGINFDAYEDISVETNGTDIPAPVSIFVEIDLGDGLNENIRRCKYVKPTPIQRYAIPIAIAGRDLMACAQTGSGKTASFCFPIISGILKGQNRRISEQYGGRTTYHVALILSPTRELSCQIHDEAKNFAYQSGVKVVVVYESAPMYQ